jgi:hypothetical protein
MRSRFPSPLHTNPQRHADDLYPTRAQIDAAKLANWRERQGVLDTLPGYTFTSDGRLVRKPVHPWGLQADGCDALDQWSLGVAFGELLTEKR